MIVEIPTEGKPKSSAIRIQWVNQGIFFDHQKGEYTSELASNRYRAIIPAQELRASGHTVEFVSASGWQWDYNIRPDLIILGKLLPSSSGSEFARLSGHILNQSRHAIAHGIPVIADFCDDHFDHPVLGPHWIQTASIATLCTAASEGMVEVVRRFSRGAVFLIPDPIASSAGTPRVFHKTGRMTRFLSGLLSTLGSQRLKLIWYGHPSNWTAMERWGHSLESLSHNHPLLLWVVTKSTDRVHRWIEQFNLRCGPSALAEWVDWSEKTQWSYVQDSDAVLIPSDTSDPKRAVKSSNRLTDALNSGRYVIASAVPSYHSYEDYCSLTEEPYKALRWMVRYPEVALEKVIQGQRVVQKQASAYAIAEKWTEVAFHAIQSLSNQLKIQDLRFPDELATSDDVQQVKTGRDNIKLMPSSSEPSVREHEIQGRSFSKDISPDCTLLELHIGNMGKVSDKWEAYFSTYERLFGSLRGNPVNLLEIGVQNGGSLEIWSQYFLKAEHIIGCDIDPRCHNLRFNDSRITVIIGNAALQTTHTHIAKICNEFDIIIDDGSHISSDIIGAFLRYFPFLKKGGLYVVEDVHAIYRDVSKENTILEVSAQNFFKQCAEFTNFEHWQDKLQAETLISSFIPSDHSFPNWITKGVIERIEFSNSMIVIRKSTKNNDLGRRLVTGTEAKIHPGVLRHQISTYSLQAISEKQLFEMAGSVDDQSKAEFPKRYIDCRNSVRLNLGCGDKLLDGYINVDVAPKRHSRSPDIVCDIRNLDSFESNYADEILAVHVIEHFYRWEIEDVLREWTRVLRPGGKMIIECPNLISACEALIKDPQSRAVSTRAGQRTMWVFYGDPAWKDPLMTHRWGYTPESLSILLKSIGLEGVRQEPAEFKLKEPRDMRIIGYKI